MLDLDDLKKRKALAELCLAVLDTVPDTDERKPDAITHIQKQLDDITKNIARIEAGGTVVGLKTAVLFGTSEKIT